MEASLSVSGPVFHLGNTREGCSEKHHCNDSRISSQKGENTNCQSKSWNLTLMLEGVRGNPALKHKPRSLGSLNIGLED